MGTKWVVHWAKSGQEALGCEAVVACLTLRDIICSKQRIGFIFSTLNS